MGNSGDNYVIKELTNKINKWQNLSYIDFSGKQLGDDSGKQFNEAFRDARFPNLLTLVLSNNQICDSGGQYLAYSLIHHYNNNLTTLILANNNLTNNGVTPFADGFNQFNTTFLNGTISGGQITKLKTLDLRGNDKVCFTGKLYFFKNIDKCKTKDTSILFDEFTIKTDNAHSLNLSNTLLSDNHYGFFNASFSAGYLSSFHTLNLSNNKMGNMGSQYLAQSLINHYCNNLTTLNLANNNLTNNGVTPFADGLSSGKITKLKYLDLRENSKICFSGMLYFFKDIDKCKTKDTSILFDKFTINTGDIHSLGLNNKLLNDSHIHWITGGLNLKWLASIHNLNLGNNQIGDEGAKLLADSLSNGRFSHLKTLRLEGNNITDEGISYFPFAIDKMNQDIKVTLLDLYNESKKGMYKNYHLSPLGDKQIKKEILTNYLEVARNLGLDVDNIAIDRTTWGFIKNKVKVSTSFLVGFAKCLIPKDGKELLTDMAIEKNPKIIKKSIIYIQNASCFDEALDKSRLTEEGIALTKYELEVIGNINSNENLYEDVLIKVGEFFDAL